MCLMHFEVPKQIRCLVPVYASGLAKKEPEVMPYTARPSEVQVLLSVLALQYVMHNGRKVAVIYCTSLLNI